MIIDINNIYAYYIHPYINGVECNLCQVMDTENGCLICLVNPLCDFTEVLHGKITFKLDKLVLTLPPCPQLEELKLDPCFDGYTE